MCWPYILSLWPVTTASTVCTPKAARISHAAWIFGASLMSRKTESTTESTCWLTKRASATGRIVYWRCPKGSTLDTPFSKLTSAKKYKAATTTRNLNTVEKML